MRSILACCLVLCVAGCADRPVAGPPPPIDSAPAIAATTAEAASVIANAADAGPDPAAAAPAWIEAVRLERWAEAAKAIDALPEATRARADMRYVRARAAVGAGDGKRAVELLEKLDAELPDLAADIERWRAEAQLLAGPYAPAAQFFARSTKARDLTRAAIAFEKAGDAARARATIDRAIAAAARGKSAREEASARMTRARLAEAQGGGAMAIAEADYRWVATRAPGTADGKGAAAALDRLKKPLGPADVPADDGEEVAPKGKPASRGAALHARGMAQWKARAYAEAVRTLRDAAAARSGHEAEDLHYAARALARLDRDDDAVRLHRQVADRYPRSVFGDRSSYHAARLDLLRGKYKEAARGYASYLAAHKKGEHREDAEYERALALMSSGGAGAAQKTFAALARKASADKAARLRQLEGLAALRAGNRPAAIAIWTEIARAQPLTWASQAARARLAEIAAPVPVLLDPPVSGRAQPAIDLRLPKTPALLASIGLDGDAEAHLAAAEREASAGYTGREGEALCGLYGLLSRGKRRYRLAQSAVEGAWLMRAPSASERWAWECIYPEPFRGGVRALEAELSIPRGLVHALMRQESAFDPAIVSPASAVGLMQLMPSTARQAAGEIGMTIDEADLVRPDVNLRLGAYYIAKLLKMWNGHVLLAAAAYNAGPRAVSHWLEAGSDNDLDLWVARIPYEETRTYVARVAQNLARYQWLSGGDDAVTPITLAMPAGLKAPPDAY